MSIEAMKQALEALELLARYENPETKIQVRKFKDDGPIVTMYPHKVATDAADVLRTAIDQADEQEAWKTSDTAYRPEGLPQDFIKHEVDSFDDCLREMYVLFQHCENEMRYAGWDKREADNYMRNDVYEQIVGFLK